MIEFLKPDLHPKEQKKEGENAGSQNQQEEGKTQRECGLPGVQIYGDLDKVKRKEDQYNPKLPRIKKIPVRLKASAIKSGRAIARLSLTHGTSTNKAAKTKPHSHRPPKWRARISPMSANVASTEIKVAILRLVKLKPAKCEIK